MYHTILKTTMNSKKYNIKDQASAIKYFIEQMDIEMRYAKRYIFIKFKWCI